MTRKEIIKHIKSEKSLLLIGENFTHEDLSYLDLTDATFRGCEFTDVEFKQSNLKFAKFINCTFVNVTFSFNELLLAEFKDCHISHSTFKHSNLERIKMKNIEGGLIDMLYCEINNAYIANTNIKELEISHSNLCKTQIYGTLSKQTDLPKLLISECDMTESMFANIKINNGTLIDCRIIECNFRETKCAFAIFDNIPGIRNNFAHANLNHALFKNINMPDTNFQFTTGSNTRFETAGITNANFEYSKLKATSFKNTNLTGIKLGSKHFEQIWDKDDVSETIDIAGCVNKDDTPIQPKASRQTNPPSPIATLQTDVERLMQNIIDEFGSISENDDEALLKVYSKQITKIKDILNRVKNDNNLPDDVKEATLDFISDIAAVFEYRKIGLATKLSIELTLKKGSHEPHDCTDKIKPNNVFTDEYYGFFISKLNAEHMVKAYKCINSTYRVANWSIADIMVNCLNIQEVNFTAYSEMLINFINDLERLEYDGFIIQATKNKTTKINEDELIAICKTDYGKYLPDDFDYKNNIVLFRGRYKV